MPNKLLTTYLGSQELKELIIQRSEELQIPFRYICRDIVIDYTEFMQQYINSAKMKLEIPEEKFERVLEILGIKVRFQFVVNKGYSPTELRQELKNNYEIFESKYGIGKQQVREETGDYPVFDGNY